MNQFFVQLCNTIFYSLFLNVHFNRVNYILFKNIRKHIRLLRNIQRLDTVVLCAGILYIHNNAKVVGPILFDPVA